MNNIGLTPLGYNVLLEMPEEQKETKSGFILTDSKTKALLQISGKILGMGFDAFTNAFGNKDPQAPKEGDYTLISQHCGLDIKIDDRLYRMVSSDEIRGIVSKERYEQLIK